MSKAQQFSCDAMATTFVLHIPRVAGTLAAEAASACFTRLEEIENDLSYFRQTSDVSRINALEEGASLFISETTHACLLRAIRAAQDTAGLFDVTRGHRNGPACGQIEILPDQPCVRCHQQGRSIDLGGIGKGFALEELGNILCDYRIDDALLCAGASTMLAIGTHHWPISLGDRDPVLLELSQMALSTTGTEIQGAHVLHPDQDGTPEYRFQRLWVLHRDAGLADAYSTACLLMDEEELAAFHSARGGASMLRIFVEDEDGRVREIQ